MCMYLVLLLVRQPGRETMKQQFVIAPNQPGRPRTTQKKKTHAPMSNRNVCRPFWSFTQRHSRCHYINYKRLRHSFLARSCRSDVLPPNPRFVLVPQLPNGHNK